MSAYATFKLEVLQHSQALARKGYLVGTGGNVSVRIEGEDALAITPSGRDYLGMAQDDICVYAFARNKLEGELAPSVEMALHVAVYERRADVNAIVHTHQPYASLFALINQPIPALFDEQVANLGNCVAVVPYALSGSRELQEHVSAHVDNQCNAFILQNHGALCLGITAERAALCVELLEKCARAYYYALSTGKPVTTLPPESEQAGFALLQSEQRREVRRKRKAARQTGTGPVT